MSRGERKFKLPQFNDATRGNAIYSITLVIELDTYEAVISGPNAPQWQVAIKDELQFLIQNKTWEVISLPPDCKLVT